MLAIDFSNLHSIYNQNTQNGISKLELQSFNKDFNNYWDKILSRKQGFIDLPYDQANLEKISEFSQKTQGRYDYIVILGIGGSMLGPKCILDALFYSLLRKKPQVICLDNIDPFKIDEINKFLDYSKTLFLVQTKSGSTPETLAQYFYFREKIESRNLSASNHFVFVTDPKNNYLREVAVKENTQTFAIPENVGGRFSVLTSVGLLISDLIGLQISKLLEGAGFCLENYKKEAFEYAVCQYILYKKGKNINVMLPYSSRLKTLAEWYTQLLAESIGKEFDLSGNLVNIGITPLTALGATDQHSSLQLFKEGPFDKLITFIEVGNHQVETNIPEINKEQFGFLSQKSFNKLLQAELDGTKQSLTESGKPNITIHIDKINEFNLAELFMFFELSTAFLGEIFEINTFNQPGVERSKILAKQFLT